MKSILSHSFNKFIITIFLLIELIGCFGIYIRYKDVTNNIVNHHQTFNINEDSLVAALESNKKDFTIQLCAFSLLIFVTGAFSLLAYQKRLSRLRHQFNEYQELLTNSVKNHEQLILDERFFYTEFVSVANTLNKILDEIYNKDNFNNLTRMPKREKFLNDTLEFAEKSEVPVIVVYIYLKDYQNLLRSRSFMFADKIIIELASRFTSYAATLENSKVAKISGNGDFLLSFPCIDAIEKTFETTAESLHKCFNGKIDFGNDGLYEQNIGIGYSIINSKENHDAIDNAYKAALLASVQKDKLYCSYSHELQAQIEQEVKLENDLKLVLEKNELDVHYQAKICAKEDRVKGAEALMRWKRNGKFENTEKFIRIAEKSDLIIKLEKFVITKVFQEQKILQSKNIFIPISINISAKHLHHHDIINFLMANSRKYDVKPELIDIEITERQRIDSNSEKVLHSLKSLGFTISIDDFGKDYSSLSYINNLPIDVIKIDKSFIDGLKSNNNEIINENSKAIISGIVKIAKGMNKKTVAEGVETKEQVDCLKALGCDELQGFYYYNGTAPIDEFIEHYKWRFITNQS